MTTSGQGRPTGSTWSVLSQPRIRHITEIRIHNLDVHAQAHSSTSHSLHTSRHQPLHGTLLDNHNDTVRPPLSPSIQTHHIRNVRKSSQNSIHSPALQEVREIADEEGYLVDDDQIDEGTPSRSPGHHPRSRTSTEVAHRDSSWTGGVNVGRSLSTSSSLTATARLTRSPRLMPRRASSNETIGDQSGSTVVIPTRRPGLNQARSRSRLIVPRPNTVVETDSAVDDHQQYGIGLSIDIPGTTDHNGIPRTRDRSNSGSSFRSGHYSSHPIHHHHTSHQHHHHHSSYPSQNHLHSQSHQSTSSTGNIGPIIGSPSATIGTLGGRRERASTITSQYAINSAGHVTLTDELGYEKKKDMVGMLGTGEDGGVAGGLGGVEGLGGGLERELVRCFVTMVLVEDLRAALMQEEDEEKGEGEVGRGEKGSEKGDGARTKRTRGVDKAEVRTNGSPPKVNNKPKVGTVSVGRDAVKRDTRGSGTASPESPNSSPRLPNRSRTVSGTTTPHPLPSPQSKTNGQTPRQPGARTRPPASRQNTMRNSSASSSYPNKASASPNRMARLVSPSRSRYGSPPQSPGLGASPGNAWSRRSSDVGLVGEDTGAVKKTARQSSSGPQQGCTDVSSGNGCRGKADRPLVPFYISPIHRKSLYPTFSGINVLSDYAPWAREMGEGVAGVKVLLEAWVEDGQATRSAADHRDNPADSVGWKRLDGVGGVIDLAKLKEIEEDRMEDLPSNTLIFRFSSTSSKTYYLPSERDSDSQTPGAPVRRDVRTVVERSLRETKMRKCVDLEGLERLVAVSRILREAQSEVKVVEMRLGRTLEEEARYDRMVKANSQIGTVNHNLESRIASLREMNAEANKACMERRRSLADRRERLERANTMIVDLQDRANELEEAVSTERQHRDTLSYPIHRHRARLINTLDTIFPIEPLDPSSLLYTILSIPLPIPTDPKSPAPPDSLPPGLKVKMDEESTATALGLVAMCLQRLGEIVRGGGDELVYPVTCVGSRSLVRDGISVISGPRSFPLYSRGVERYRYEYAIFLLNKDIEMMMIQADILVQDPRHTLPNLKTLLLTLASRDRPRGSMGGTSSGEKVEKGSMKGLGSEGGGGVGLGGFGRVEEDGGGLNVLGNGPRVLSKAAGEDGRSGKSLSMASLAALSGGRMG